MDKVLLSVLINLLLLGAVCCRRQGERYFDIHRYDEMEYENCVDPKFKTDHRDNVRLTQCRPMDTVIQLEPEDPEIMKLVPSTVIVKRCGDCGCYGNKSCIPTQVNKVQKAVRQIKKFRNDCGWVTILEHVKCKCGCELTPQQCYPKQTFLAKECMCQCKEEFQRDKRDCIMNGKEWSERHCSCSCPAGNKRCSTGTVWVPDMCKCVKLMHMDILEDSNYVE